MSRQRWDPEQYASNARFVSDLGEPVLELLAPKPGERVLDLGCGDGALTEKLVEAGCIVTGVDASAEQVEAARARGLDARVEQVEHLPFDGGFDAVFSNAVLHWVHDQHAALTGVARALEPGGRFVGELGGDGCVAAIRRALVAALASRGIDGAARDPWFFPTTEQYETLLVAHGFRVESLRLFPRPTPLPGDIAGWLATFAQPFLHGLEGAEREAVVDDARERLRPELQDAEGRWTADYVRLRFAARKVGAGV
ncbi:MAG: methyltransferase domain-containing protein [Myxococcota bacterium]|nr:methyltransferase domain-containing protein [Myxococcota bacterium]